jgi:hypothetical protein
MAQTNPFLPAIRSAHAQFSVVQHKKNLCAGWTSLQRRKFMRARIIETRLRQTGKRWIHKPLTVPSRLLVCIAPGAEIERHKFVTLQSRHTFF